jgi:hypothetical protein
MQNAFDEGAEARLSGLPETANPYPVEDDEHLDWNDGWASIDDVDEEG